MEVIRKRLTPILSTISPSCRDAVRILSETRDCPLPMIRRMGLRIHLFLCAFCRRYERQLGILTKTPDPDPHPDQPLPSRGLPEDGRRRIIKRLEELPPLIH